MNVDVAGFETRQYIFRKQSSKKLLIHNIDLFCPRVFVLLIFLEILSALLGTLLLYSIGRQIF
jgi:hypothetical protein